jgi:hypothetical protein
VARDVVALALALALAGCSRSEEAKVIEWDLAQSHMMADVDWPRPDLDANEITPVESVEIRLPEGRVFEPGFDVARVDLAREGETVIEILVFSEPLTAEEAYRHASRIAAEWGFDQEPLEGWYAEAQAKAPIDVQAVETSAGIDHTLGPEGPQPLLGVLDSFNDERPWMVKFELFWP